MTDDFEATVRHTCSLEPCEEITNNAVRSLFQCIRLLVSKIK